MVKPNYKNSIVTISYLVGLDRNDVTSLSCHALAPALGMWAIRRTYNAFGIIYRIGVSESEHKKRERNSLYFMSNHVEITLILSSKLNAGKCIATSKYLMANFTIFSRSCACSILLSCVLDFKFYHYHCGHQWQNRTHSVTSFHLHWRRFINHWHYFPLWVSVPIVIEPFFVADFCDVAHNILLLWQTSVYYALQSHVYVYRSLISSIRQFSSLLPYISIAIPNALPLPDRHSYHVPRLLPPFTAQ